MTPAVQLKRFQIVQFSSRKMQLKHDKILLSSDQQNI